MRTDYADFDHAGWVEEHTKQSMSVLGKQIANILGYVGGGIYNAPFSVKRVDWSDSHCIKVFWRGQLSNWDLPQMSALWVLCHQRMVRVEISPGTPRALKLEFWQRHTREGNTSVRLPDCGQMIEMIDGHFADRTEITESES